MPPDASVRSPGARDRYAGRRPPVNHAFGLAPPPARLRRIDALTKARHRLVDLYRADRRLPNGDHAHWLLRLDEGGSAPPDAGLALSTRFGPAIAFDYGPLLLACSGVDIDGGLQADARIALARYAFAAMPSPLQSALGDPTVCERPAGTALREAAMLAVNLLLCLPSIRLTMRLLLTADGLHALLDSGEWKRAATPFSLPAWLSHIDASIPLVVGHTTLRLDECDALTRGDVVRLAVSAFDVAGNADIRLAACRLHLRWLDAQHCFEVQSMLHDTDRPGDAIDPDITADATAGTSEEAGSKLDPSAIPIRLSFSLGKLASTVGELAALGPGSLLKLANALPPHVTIEANGLPVGAGELVDLDGRLGVQITQWGRGNARSLEP